MSSTEEINLIYSPIHPVVWATRPCIDYTHRLGGIIYRTEGGTSPSKYFATQEFGAVWTGLFWFFFWSVLFLDEAVTPALEEEVCSKPRAPRRSRQCSAGHVLRAIPASTSTLCTTARNPAPANSLPSRFLSRNMLRKRESEKAGFAGFVPPPRFLAGNTRKMQEICKNQLKYQTERAKQICCVCSRCKKNKRKPHKNRWWFPPREN